MTRIVKTMAALLAAGAVLTVFAGGVWAQTQVASDADLTDVRNTLEKAGVKDAAKIPVLPMPAAVFFKAANQDTQAMMKAYDEAAKQIPAGGRGSSMPAPRPR